MTQTLSSFNMSPLFCPFCGAPSAVEGGSLEIEGCNHLMFVIAADFYIHVSETLDANIKSLGWTIERGENGLIEIEAPDDEEFVDLAKAVPHKCDLVVFEQLSGPPSLHSTLTAFAYFESE